MGPSSTQKEGIESPFVILLPSEWQEYARRPRWFAMAKHTVLLAIEPPAGILTFWLHPRRIRDAMRYRFGVRRSEDGIYFFRPISLVPYAVGYRIGWMARIDRMIIRIQLLRALNALGMSLENTVCFVFKVQQHYLADLIPDAIRCYEITDEYLVRPDEIDVDYRKRNTKRALKSENKILAVTDIVLASSPALQESRKRRFANTHYFPNSADYEHFSSALDDNIEMPEDIAAISLPRLGYLGNINELINLDLIIQLAMNLSDVSVVFIGKENGSRKLKRSQSYRKMKSLPNVHFMGYRSYERLPAYLKGFSACILPFRMNEWMRNSFPNKIFQYLAAGKPIVSTDFPTIRNFTDSIYIASSISEFITLVNRAIHEDNDVLVKIRQEEARLNSTNVRARQTLDIIEDFLSSRQSSRKSTHQ
jgi:glycosyltransferase involved in cell wall biosynthesis